MTNRSSLPRPAFPATKYWLVLITTLLLTSPVPVPADWPALPDVVRRLKTEQPGLPDPAPGASNVLGFLETLAPQVLLARDVDPQPGVGPEAAEGTNALLKTTVYDAGGTAGYLRLGRIGSTARSQLESALGQLRQSNTLIGVVLDLRLASGSDLAAGLDAAGALAHRPLEGVRLPDGDGSVKPAAPHQPLPVMVLVNRDTRGAAEVLAAALRRSSSPSLIVGAPTAGQARSYREVSFAPDARILVGGTPVVLPGTNPLADGGLTPDLSVTVEPADEKAYLTNEFVRVTQGRPSVAPGSIRLNEAELVRRRGGGAGGGHRAPHPGPEDSSTPGRRLGRARSEDPPPAAPSVQDPVLARALDVLAGLVSEATPSGDRADSR